MLVLACALSASLMARLAWRPQLPTCLAATGRASPLPQRHLDKR